MSGPTLHSCERQDAAATITCLLVPVRMVHSVNYFVVVSVIDSRSDYCYKRPPRDCWNLSRQLHF